MCPLSVPRGRSSRLAVSGCKALPLLAGRCPELSLQSAHFAGGNAARSRAFQPLVMGHSLCNNMGLTLGHLPCKRSTKHIPRGPDDILDTKFLERFRLCKPALWRILAARKYFDRQPLVDGGAIPSGSGLRLDLRIMQSVSQRRLHTQVEADMFGVQIQCTHGSCLFPGHP